MGSTTLGRTRGARLSVTARLLLASLVPILAFCAVGLGFVLDRRDDVEKAEAVADRVVELNRLIALRTALFAERVAAELLVPERRPPDEALATTDFGVLVLDSSAPLAAATDEALARVPPELRPFEAEELEAIRAERASWSRSPETIRARLGPLATRTEEVMATFADEIRDTAIELGDDRLIAAGTSFQRATRLPDAAAEVFGTLSDLWAAEASDRPALQSAVASQLARYETMAAIFEASLIDADGPVAEFWRTSGQLPDAVRGLLDDVLAGEFTTPERPPGEPVVAGLVLLEAIDWVIDGDELRLVAAQQMIAVASDVAADAGAAERRTIALVALAVGISVAGILLFGRSIVLPLGRLTRHAEQIGQGDLDLAPLPLRGPPDLVAASAAVNDVVGTLRLLEAKSRALADVDLRHPSLDEPLPGELGAALQRSAAVLSTSVADRERLRAQLQHDATHDSLTGLANREALTEALRDPAAGAPGAAVVFVDLDNFKQIRNRLGHRATDLVLQTTAERLASLTPAGSTLARVGADQFVALLLAGAAPDPPELARRMVDAVSQPVELREQAVLVQACAGVAAVEDPEAPLPGPSDLLQRADLAVSHAKRSEPGTVAVYDEAFGRRVADESDVEDALAVALEPGADELRVVFQPIVAATSGAIVGLETLVRWLRDGEVVPPDHFVPVAERSGLVGALDLWVLDAAARQLAAWQDVPALAGVPVSVNMSGRTLLRSSLAEDVGATIERHGIPPSRITVEVTETALVTDLALAANQLEDVRRTGVRIAIDDFGTGFTSIAQLRALPVDELKIDGSFVQRLPDRGDQVLVQMITDLARHLGLFTVAEGVEEAEQAEILRAIGCDALQGYHFARPVDVATLEAWFAERGHTATSRPAG